MALRALLLLCVATWLPALAWGCSGDDDSAGDASVPSGDGGLGATLGVPWLGEGAPPVAPPALGPCPSGWRALPTDDGYEICEPLQEGGGGDCGSDQALFPGEAACTRVGTECPPDGVPADLPADRPVIYVVEGAAAGDGSRASPYGSLTGFSWASLRTGTIVALGAGRWDAAVRLTPGVTLWGACVADAVLAPTASSGTEGTVTVIGADTGLRNLSIAESPRPGVWVSGAGRSISIEQVVISGAELAGLSASNDASVTARDVAVRDSRGRALDGAFGRGITIEHGAQVTLSRGELSRNREAAIQANGVGTNLILEDALLRDTDGQLFNLLGGWGLGVQTGASAQASRVVSERNRHAGIQVLGGTDPASLRLEDAVVRDTDGDRLDGKTGHGIEAQSGVTVQITRALFDHNRDVGILTFGEGTVVTLADVVVRDTMSQRSDSMAGRAVSAELGSVVEGARMALDRNREFGVHAMDPGTVFRFEDLLVRDTAGQESDGRFGRGLNSQVGASVEVTRAILQRSRGVGAAALGGTSVLFEDVAILDTREDDCSGADCGATQGVALGSYGGSVRAARFLIEEATVCGAHVAADGGLDLTQGVIRGNTIGACIQVADFDVARLSERVAYLDNGANLDTTDLPLPDPATGVGGMVP